MNFAKGWPVLLVFRTEAIASKAKNSACFVYISEIFDSLTCPSAIKSWTILLKSFCHLGILSVPQSLCVSSEIAQEH